MIATNEIVIPIDMTDMTTDTTDMIVTEIMIIGTIHMNDLTTVTIDTTDMTGIPTEVLAMTIEATTTDWATETATDRGTKRIGALLVSMHPGKGIISLVEDLSTHLMGTLGMEMAAMLAVGTTVILEVDETTIIEIASEYTISLFINKIFKLLALFFLIKYFMLQWQ